MTDYPKVTIITPVYNCVNYIGETIYSVLTSRWQNYPNIDYVIIDDASTDHADKIISRYSDFITIIQHNVNQGEQKTVNEGLRMVTGKYFMIVNADDPLLPGCVSKLVEAMESHPDVLCAYPDWLSINEDGSTRLEVKVKDYDFNYMVRHHTCLPSVGSMFRSTLIQLIGYRDTSYRWLGDFDYWYRVGMAGKMLHVPLTLATWRNRSGQLSKDKSDLRAQEHIRLASQFNDNPEAIAWSYLVAASVTDSKLKMIQYCIEALKLYPRLLIDFEYYDALIQRAKYILRR